jgi:hypothetical protein
MADAVRRRQQPEKREQQAIARFLTTIGAKVYTLGTRRPIGDYPGTRQTPGLPDLLAFVPAGAASGAWQLLAIEVKAPGGRMRPDQQAFREYCELAGVPHVVGGINDVIAWLIEHGIVRAYQVPHYRLPAAAATTEG